MPILIIATFKRNSTGSNAVWEIPFVRDWRAEKQFYDHKECTMKKISFLRFLVILFVFFSISCKGQNKEERVSVRLPAVAGSFYPADAAQLKKQLNDFFSAAADSGIYENLAAVIVPHAGYVFSGEVAASAYARIDPDKKYDHVFIIGPSHHVYLDGASLCNIPAYSTPLGKVDVDTALVSELIRQYRFFSYDPEAHSEEHSIEVQLPFLQYRLNHHFRIVPIVIGTQSPSVCQKIAEALKPYFNGKNLFVISSDFSHYPTYAGALEADKRTGNAVESGSPDEFLKVLKTNGNKQIPGLVTSACGQAPILTLLYITSETPGIRIQHIRYLNSGDTEYGDKNKVVGYHSFIFRREQQGDPVAFSLSDDEKKILLKIAKEAIRSRFNNEKFSYVADSLLTPALKTKCGAFVTLNEDGHLRGCVGQFDATDPLYLVVERMAIAAAFLDSRFEPVKKEELGKIDLEISVLTPLKRISNIDDFILGKQGIYMVRGNHSGTFLPQVAKETGWNKTEFLGHCARDKAGIGWDGWKDAELYTYEAYVFSEKGLSEQEK